MRISMVVLICVLLAVPCTAEVIVCFPMDSDPNWTTEGQWEFGVPQGGGGPQSYDPTSGYTGANVYGYNLAGNYENDMPEYRLTTSALNCGLAENVTLSFWRWLGVESSLYDRAKIQVSNDGTNWTGVWVNGDNDIIDSSWLYCEYDISAVADRQPTVFVRWCMGPTDFSAAYAGWNIDDVCLDGDTFDALSISPSDGFLSVGLAGGPFEPPCKTYTLTNEDTSALNWTAEGTESWLDVTPGSGTLSPSNSVAVQVCIGPDANTLMEGKYTDTVSFTNTNSGFSYSIDVTLYVYVFVGGEVLVPLDFDTIQAAIDASSDGDTIIVLDGTYTGDGNRDIDFNGRAITLKSVNGPESCIIACGGTSSHPHRGFYFHSGETSQSIVDGFTIVSGWIGSYGAGIRCGYSSPTIRNCIITRNIANTGGGMYNDHSNPILTNCTFRGNFGKSCGGIRNSYSSPTLVNCNFNWNHAWGYEFGGGWGGGMGNQHSNPTLTNCTFRGNSVAGGGEFYGNGGGMYNGNSNPILTNCIFIGNEAPGTGYGGGMWNHSSNTMLTNCTFAGNLSADAGGGLYNTNCKPTLTNCIFWGNSDDGGVNESAQIHTRGIGGPVINYSCIQGWTGNLGGIGNIDADPLFVDADGIDNIVGTEDDNLRLLAGSPCINAGDNSVVTVINDLDGNPRIRGDAVDIGAYEASITYHVDGATGDNENDGLTRETAFETIQFAIDKEEVVDGYTILVWPGVYNETATNGINFTGKAITVKSAADAAVLEVPGFVAVTFAQGEDANSVFSNFVVRGSSTGIFALFANPTINNVTVVGNDNGFIADNANPTITNSIFWNNTNGDLFGSPEPITAQYSCVEKGGEGEGNISIEPLFADANNGDYHLLSERGRYWPAHDVWVLDKVTSPCVGGGDPTVDPANEPMPNGGRINMGAYGNTAYASMSEWAIAGDVNRDGVFDMVDFAILAGGWLEKFDWAD